MRTPISGAAKEIFPQHYEENGMNNIKMADNAEIGK
jgi:hypothetical protein